MTLFHYNTCIQTYIKNVFKQARTKEKSKTRLVPCSCFSTRFSSCKIDDISQERTKTISLGKKRPKLPISSKQFPSPTFSVCYLGCPSWYQEHPCWWWSSHIHHESQVAVLEAGQPWPTQKSRAPLRWLITQIKKTALCSLLICLCYFFSSTDLQTPQFCRNGQSDSKPLRKSCSINPVLMEQGDVQPCSDVSQNCKMTALGFCRNHWALCPRDSAQHISVGSSALVRLTDFSLLCCTTC